MSAEPTHWITKPPWCPALLAQGRFHFSLILPLCQPIFKPGLKFPKQKTAGKIALSAVPTDFPKKIAKNLGYLAKTQRREYLPRRASAFLKLTKIPSNLPAKNNFQMTFSPMLLYKD
jgi:hypothetical protein